MPNKWLPGVGPHTAGRLQAAGLARIGQVAATPVELLELVLGRMAPAVRQFARGIDDRPVVAATGPPKSYGQQETFAQDVTDEGWLVAVLRRMADDLMAKVRAEGKAVRTLTVKVRYNDMDEDQRSETLAEPTDLETDVYGRLPVHAAPRLETPGQPAPGRRCASPTSMTNGGAPNCRWPPRRSSTTSAAAWPGCSTTCAAPTAATASCAATTCGCARIRSGGGNRAALRPPRASLRPGVPVARPPATVLPALPLNVRSVYSFLDSTLTPAAIVGLAAQHGLPAVALTDTGNLHGVVEFAQAARQAGVKPLIGAEVRVEGRPLLLYVENARGYGHLYQLLSRLNESGARPRATRATRVAGENRDGAGTRG